MQRLLLNCALVAALPIGACSGPFLDSPQPPSAPGLTDVNKVIIDTASMAGSPQTYTAAGYVTVEERCGDFFDKLALYKSNSNFWSAEVATAGATTAGILALLAAGTTAIGIVGLGAGVIASSIANFQNFALVTPYPVETRQLVFAALQTAKTAKPANVVTDPYDARSTVAAYAHYCTYAGIATLARQAIQNAANNTVNAAKSTIPDPLLSAIAARAGGPLTDKQLAFLVVLKSQAWNDTQRSAAVEAMALAPPQRLILFTSTTSTYLSPIGFEIANLGESLMASYPQFAALVAQVTATMSTKVQNTRELVDTLSFPSASVFGQVPTPRVIVGR
jgi:hypothetical protein